MSPPCNRCPVPRLFAKPSLVYAPFNAATPSVGRFYMAWLNKEDGLVSSQEARPYITFTRGNRFPLTSPMPGDPQDLRFLGDNLMRNEWTIVNSGVSLVNVGGRVRGAMEESPGRITFLPSADGIFKANLRDSDDYTTVLQNMTCALGGTCAGI